jgi:signal transduction histidine kinase/ligand-binding sensor domain-containing protein
MLVADLMHAGQFMIRSSLRHTSKKAMSWRYCFVLVLALLGSTSALALDPNKHITQYAHAAWRIQDGFFRTSPSAFAQTADGYLWVGTFSELLRFDGVRFVPWSPEPGGQLPSSSVVQLLVARDGSLWIASHGGLSRWKDQKLTNYPRLIMSGGSFVFEDGRGRIWFPKAVAPEKSLCEVVGPGTRCYGSADGVPSFGAASAIEDRDGNLWFGGDTTLLRWNGNSPSVYHLPKPAKQAGGILALASTSGTLWVGTGSSGRGLGLLRFDEGHWSTFKTHVLDSSNLHVLSLYADREGVLWIGTYDQGMYRIRGNEVDHFDSTAGLSSDEIARFFEDREGNLWVATSLGVDRFADTPVVSLTTKEGLCCAEASSILASRDGSIWTGGDGALTNLRDGIVSCLRAGNGLPGSQVTSLLEDHAGRLWAGVDQNLWVRENGAFRRIEKPDGSAVGFVTGITEDTEHNVWIAVNSPRRIMMRIGELTVRQEYQEPRAPRKLVADPTGGIWIGLLNGDLAHIRNDQHETYHFVHDDSALVNQLLPLSDGSVLAATTYGLVAWSKGRLLYLNAKNGLPCGATNAMTFDSQGNLWLFMDCGLGQMTSADLQTWLRNPDAKLSIKTLDVLDGVSPGRAAFMGAATSTDGRLWFANGNFLQTIDPGHVHRDTVPPPVHIEQVVADRKNYSPIGVVRLPARTRDLEIDYVGLSYSVPQKVLFRYRLDGRDPDWQEPGTRRQAFYSDLRPGTYRFRVTASNNDGLWNEDGAALELVVAPAFYQNIWFQTSGAITFLALLWGLYRYRLHQMAHQLNLRLEERVTERTRIARELHDTLLQSFQGLMLRFQAVYDLLPEGKAKDQLEQTLQRGDQAIAEGRTAVYDLRSSTLATNNLVQALKSLGADLATPDSPPFRLVAEGDSRDLHPILRDEIYRIAREALRNAFSHAEARQIETEIIYGERELRLRIRDDGKGIPSDVLKEGRHGHYGLCGMRERAQQIGGKLAIWSQPGAGTEIELSVGSEIAYRSSAGISLWRLFRKKAG